MREQAKKMNVASLRNSEADKSKAIEIKLAKVALTTISLWFFAWTPYTIINYAGIFESMHLSPLSTICGSVFAKANAVCNPIVYGLRYYLISFLLIYVYDQFLNASPATATRSTSRCYGRRCHAWPAARTISPRTRGHRPPPRSANRRLRRFEDDDDCRRRELTALDLQKTQLFCKWHLKEKPKKKKDGNVKKM